jgi:NTP pyrophosphatase (non-canonical NTP hydrolase)
MLPLRSKPVAGAEDTQNASLAAYQQYVQQVMKERGFDDERVSQKFMLLLEEAGEFAKAARKNAHLAQATDTAVEDLNDAAADVFAILLDICNQVNIDLEQSFLAREKKNQARTWE